MKKLLFTIFFIFTFMFNANASGLLSYKYASKVLVLMYHKLSENPAEWSDFCTSPQNFENDIIYLKSKGYVFKTASELAAEQPDESQKIAILTFDDGYKSDYTYALPILEKHSAKATFFVIGGFVGMTDYLDEASLKKLSESPLAEIGNHSYDLHKKKYTEIFELQNSNKYLDAVNDFEKNALYLENVIGKAVKSLSYPNGIYSEKVNSQIMQNNVSITFSTGCEKYVYKLKRPVGRKNRAHKLSVESIIK